MDNSLKSLFRWLVDFFYPINCVGCGRPRTWLCEECSSKLSYISELTCLVCGKPAIAGFTHPRCATRYTPERILCFYDYRQKEVASLVKLLKYKGYTSVASAMAGLVVEALQETGAKIGKEAIVVPVPLFPLRELKRKFNQAEILGREVAGSFGLDIRCDLVQRVRNTPSQTNLKEEARRKNVHEAFAVAKAKESFILGKDFIVVDDVYTTGATILEVCRILKRAGARWVYALTFAH